MILKEPIKIKEFEVRNRIVMPPMATSKSQDGKVNDDLVSYYQDRAKAVGIIIVEHEYVSKEGMAHKGQLSIAKDSVIDGYQKLTDAVHKEGALIFAQINHAGSGARDTNLETIAPSAVSLKPNTPLPKEMTKEDINRVIQCFVDAALRVKKAGFDGVEIHAAHGYLLSQFYSPLTNKRNDEYTGNTLEGRTLLHKQIIHAVRKAVGDSYPIALRFGGCDYMEGGSTKEEVARASKIFEDTGIDLLDISGGLNGFTIPGHTEPGWFGDISKLAKDATSIPVIVTGGIQTAKDAETILEDHQADLIGIGRCLLKDPAWAEKALAEIH